jgi:uncharacterized protein YfkK (UPF0435 family)
MIRDAMNISKEDAAETTVSIASTVLFVMGIITTLKEKGFMDLQTLQNHVERSELLSTEGKITRLLAKTVIAPATFAAKDFKNLPISSKLMELNVDVFTAFTMQTFNVLTTIYKLPAGVALALLTTGREDFGEPAEYPLDTDLDIKTIEKTEVSEQKNVTDTLNSDAVLATMGELGVASTEAAVMSVASKDLNDMVQAIYVRNNELKIDMEYLDKDGKSAKHTIIIPITIRLDAVYATLEDIVQCVQPSNINNTFIARYHKWKSGGLSTWNFIFATDLIKEAKKSMLSTTTNLYQFINKKKTASNAAMLKTLGVSVGMQRHYNGLILTTDQLSKVEEKLGGKVENFSDRERLMDAMGLLFLFIVDNSLYEVITMYTVDIKEPSTIAFTALDKKGKNSGNGDLMELFKSMLSGRAASLV